MGTGRGSTSSQASVASAGYSGTPLAAKLGIKAGDRVALVGAPDGYRAWLGELPVVEDLPILLAKIHNMQRGDPPFSARSYYDERERLIVEFSE